MGLGLFIAQCLGNGFWAFPRVFPENVSSQLDVHMVAQSSRQVFQNLLIVEPSKTAALVVTGSHGQTRSTTCKR